MMYYNLVLVVGCTIAYKSLKNYHGNSRLINPIKESKILKEIEEKREYIGERLEGKKAVFYKFYKELRR